MSDQAEPQVPVTEDALAPVAVIAHDEAAALATPKTPPAPRGAPKWETEARERVKAAIKRFSKPLAERGP